MVTVTQKASAVAGQSVAAVIDKRLQSYYTDDEVITSFMVSELELAEGDRVLEPSAGEGHFVEQLLSAGFDGEIDAIDISPEAVDVLGRKYSGTNVNVLLGNTLTDERIAQRTYSKIVGNPPYGAWNEISQRAIYKKKFDGLYAKESYALFLYHCLRLLEPGGKLCFIIPDTYLFLNRHTQLRRFLMEHFLVENVLIFPSSLFPGVAFGYSNLSILTVRRPNDSAEVDKNVIQVGKGFSSPSEFGMSPWPADVESYALSQAEVRSSPQAQLVLGEPAGNTARECVPLGELAACVTGLYTGNNKEFLAVSRPGVRLGKGYPVMPEESIAREHVSLEPLIGHARYIPIVKGSSEQRYVRRDLPWLVQWDEDALDHYRNDKKARLQNVAFYFQRGLAVPMVKGKNILVTEFDRAVFDQSIVGVFPYRRDMHDYLLAFLNTDRACSMIHQINPTANNSANYIKRLQVPLPSESESEEISALVELLRADPNNGELRMDLEAIFDRMLGA